MELLKTALLKTILCVLQRTTIAFQGTCIKLEILNTWHCVFLRQSTTYIHDVTSNAWQREIKITPCRFSDISVDPLASQHEHIIRLNTLRSRQNGRHFPDDIFKCIFLNENVWISLQISLKFVPKGPINSNPALVQIMAWRRQATSHYLNQCWLVYWRIFASLGLNELMLTYQ